MIGLDRVHPVLGLVPDDRSLGLEDVVRDLHPVQPEPLVHLLADLGLAVVERRQAVHELDGRVAGLGDELGVDLVGREELDPLVPDRRVLAHRDPDVRVEEVDALHALVGALGQGDPGAGVLRDLPAASRRGPRPARGASARTTGRPCPASRRRSAASRPCCCGRRRGSSTRSGSAACPRTRSSSGRRRGSGSGGTRR